MKLNTYTYIGEAVGSIAGLGEVKGGQRMTATTEVQEDIMRGSDLFKKVKPADEDLTPEVTGADKVTPKVGE